MLEERKNTYKHLMSSWDRLKGEEEDFVSLFYIQLFKARPDYKALFNDDLTTQKLKFTEMVNMLINSLNYLDDLIPVIKDLGDKHVTYGVKDEDYDVLIDVFIDTLDEIPSEVTDEEMSAWRSTLLTLKTIMTEKG